MPSPDRSKVSTALGAVALIAATVGGTLLVEHRVLGGGDHDEHGHGDADGHAEHGDEHGDEHGEEGHGEEGHGEEGHGEEHGEGHGDRVELTDEQLKAANVVLGSATKGTVVVSTDLPGEIALNGEAMAHVGPRVGGTVRKVHKKLGDKVKKGDVLALLDSVDVAEMHGEVQAARERLTLAKANYSRKKRLYEEKITSNKDFLEAKQIYAEAKVNLSSAQRALTAKTGGSGSGGGYSLIAPLSGTIVGWHLGVGEVLKEDARAFTIADLSSVWVNITVYAKDLPRVRIGQRVLVSAEGIDKPVEGTISYLSQTVEEITRSATARVVLEQPGEAWRPGLFITAELELDEVEADVVVPEGAVQRLEGKHVVFVREGKALEARAVVLGRHGHEGDMRVVEIVRGLKQGDLYVHKNSFLIKAELGKASAGHSH